VIIVVTGAFCAWPLFVGHQVGASDGLLILRIAATDERHHKDLFFGLNWDGKMPRKPRMNERGSSILLLSRAVHAMERI
jgi:hypothetical protein